MVASRLDNMQQGARTDIVEISTMSQVQAANLLNVSRVAIGLAVEAELSNRKGSNQYKSKVDCQNFGEINGERKDDIVAEKSGFGNKETYRQAKNVVDSEISVSQIPSLWHKYRKLSKEYSLLLICFWLIRQT